MIRFNANLFRLAFSCASNEETRYYLKGVYVEPHAQGGVTLTATDGHRLICIRDENGQADESAIINLGDALKQCKPKRNERRDVVIYTGSNDAHVMLTTVDHEGVSTSGKKTGAEILTDSPIAMAYGVKVDGSYPDYRRVVPQEFTDKGAPGFAGQYIAAFGDIACDLAVHQGLKAGRHSTDCYSPLRVLCQDDKKPEGCPALVLFPRCDFAFGILMPVRIASDAPLNVPSWFRAPAAPSLAPAEPAFVDVSTVTDGDVTAKLSNAVRCF
ncbi:hypothetical protein [Bradyrhizobium liaoningense]|uniref:hypothetical protein n=1 Tax=Bradyrhizobium liaoningense TaxID=43992 RepID=UPI0004BB9670|nr:hypothetical protein [Bradyrhizobium liaoningense]